MSNGNAQHGDVIVDNPQPCASCGEPAHIVMKDGRPLCARCYRDARKPKPPPPPATSLT